MIDRRTFIGGIASGVLVLPLGAFAQQQSKVWRVGFLSLSSASESAQNTAALVKGLQELGYIEGKNLVVEWRFADGSFERLTGLATELVQLKVDVIVAVASAAISGAQKATSTIPIRSAGHLIRFPLLSRRLAALCLGGFALLPG